VNADIRKHCYELAEQGFLSVAPDLFWRQEPGVNLTVTSEADWQHGLRLYGAYDRDAGAKNVKDTDILSALLTTVYCIAGDA
jgi:carboxymethylenebutenolidase